MPTAHAYTTTVVSEDGSFKAEVISLPQYFEWEHTAQRFEQLTEALDVQRGAEVTEESLQDLLQQVAYETPAARRAPPVAKTQVIETVAQEPIVVLERSPAIGSSLTALLSQGAAAHILIAEGKPFLALAFEAGVVVVWFAAGPVQGLREGARDATKTVATELLEGWLRKRFSRPRRS